MINYIGPSKKEGLHSYQCKLCGVTFDSQYGIENVQCGCWQVSPVPLYGPGGKLMELLDELSVNPGGCQCLMRAVIMNQLGVDGCRAGRETVVGWLNEAAWSRSLLERVSVAWEAFKQPWLCLYSPLQSIVDEAIKRAEMDTSLEPTGEDVQSHLGAGVLSSQKLQVLMNLTVPLPMIEAWLDDLARRGQVASLVQDGQKHYGLPAKVGMMS